MICDTVMKSLKGTDNYISFMTDVMEDLDRLVKNDIGLNWHDKSLDKLSLCTNKNGVAFILKVNNNKLYLNMSEVEPNLITKEKITYFILKSLS